MYEITHYNYEKRIFEWKKKNKNDKLLHSFRTEVQIAENHLSYLRCAFHTKQNSESMVFAKQKHAIVFAAAAAMVKSVDFRVKWKVCCDTDTTYTLETIKTAKNINQLECIPFPCPLIN